VSRNQHTDSAVAAKAAAQELALGPLMFQAARCLHELGILAVLGRHEEEGCTLAELQNESQVSMYGVTVLIEAGLGASLVAERDSRYFLTKKGWFLLTDKMTQVNMEFVHHVCYLGAFHLEESIRESFPAGLRHLGPWSTIYEGLHELPGPEKASWHAFDHFYSDAAFSECLPLVFRNKPRTLLDVGGNTGKWAVACLEHDPDVEVTVLDYPSQLESAMARARTAGVANRLQVRSMNLLDHSIPFPSGFDAVWMSQFLDCFGEDDIRRLARRSRAALTDTGEVFVLEPFIDRQQVPIASNFLQLVSLYFTALANGSSRFYRSGDFHRLLKQADLVLVEEQDTLGLGHTLQRWKTSPAR
jgi:hypothetical protein